MRITGAGTFPSMQIAKAYGVKSPSSATPIDRASKPLAIEPVRPDSYQPSKSLDQLVAAKISQPVSFDSSALPAIAPRRMNESGAFQMYTRAADKIEAAIAVQIGRTIDLAG